MNFLYMMFWSGVIIYIIENKVFGTGLVILSILFALCELITKRLWGI